jgi:hypothetical protein
MYHTTANSTIHDMGFRPQTLFMELQVHKKKWSYRTLTSTYIRFISNHTTSVTKTKGKEQLHISSLWNNKIFGGSGNPSNPEWKFQIWEKLGNNTFFTC